MKDIIRSIVIGTTISLTVCVQLSAGAENQKSTQWYKGNTHAHSLWSDGNDFPEMITDWYKSHGYHFLAMSDHNVIAVGERWRNTQSINRRAKVSGVDIVAKYIDRFGDRWVESRERDGKTEIRLKMLEEYRTLFEEDGKFLLMQGEEISDRTSTDHHVHLNAVNLPEIIYPQGGDTPREVIRNNMQAAIKLERETGQPILVHLNHPNFRRGVTAEDLAHVIEERFFEVYNAHPGIPHFGTSTKPGDERLWDIANTIRLGELNAPPLFGIGTDDSHTYHGGIVSPGKGWIMVRAAELSPKALISAMRRGDFYASSGVTLKDVRFDAEAVTLTIEIHAEEGETYTTEFIGTEEGYDASSEPRTNKEGKELPVTRIYSTDVGRTLAKVEGTTAVYKFTGKELYVRATISSDKKPVNPSFKNQVKQAWTQPVGWEE